MQVNPDNHTFGAIRALVEEEMKKIIEIEREEQEEVLATGSKEKLEKLQNDLRRAGYHQQSGK